MTSRDRDAWATKTLAAEEDLSWAAWIQGFFILSSTADDSAERVWVRNYQELYTRDMTLIALGDVEGRRGLDIAGGDGSYGIVLSAMGASMACQDLASESIAAGRRNAAKARVDIDFRVGDAQELQFDDGSFDFCISSDFFEHITIDQKRVVLGEIYRVLKPGGLCVIKTPNLTYHRLTIWLKRAVAIMRLQSPRVFIAHTRDNPDREHHGLTTFRELEGLVRDQFFLDSERIPLQLRRRGLPPWLGRRLRGFWPVTEHIILRFRKSVFVPVGDFLDEL